MPNSSLLIVRCFTSWWPAAAVMALGAPAFAVSDFDPHPGPPASEKLPPPPPEDLTKAKFIDYGAPKADRETRKNVAPAGTQPTGAMTGKLVFTSGGHGWHWASGTNWDTDRGISQGMVEDFGNQEQMSMYVQYCFNAGATVIPFRPVGHQTNEVVLKNPTSIESGSWADGSSTPYFGDAGDASKYKVAAASATETAVARFTPNLPQSGYYPVYAWALEGSNRCVDQLYRVVHTGGYTEVRVNHRRVGRGWVYLGTYYFESGTGGYVEVSNQSSSPAGSNAIADAVRFGNGMGTVVRGSGTSGFPKEDEAARYWAEAMNGRKADGTPFDSTVYNTASDDGDDNVGTPPRAAAYMNRQGEGADTERVFVSFHSNAGGGRGADGLWNNGTLFPGTMTPNQYRLAELLGREINQDLVAIGSPPLESAWTVKSNTAAAHTYYRTDYAFGEIRRDSIGGEMDASIIEVAFHDSALDGPMLRDAKVRNWIARASYQATVKYFTEFASGPSALLPEPPTHLRVTANNGVATVAWNAPAATSIGGHAPTGYRVYRSTNGYGFGQPVTVSGAATTSVQISGLEAGQVTYFRVVSVNAGGESLPGETLAVRPAATGGSSVLIVNGFDRMDRAMNPKETGPGIGTYDRVKPLRSNSYDYVVQHAKALHAANRSFDSSSNEAVAGGQPGLAGYACAVWILGEESTGDATFNASEQTMVTNWLNSGGKNLFLSGAEIGWDLDLSNNGRSFYENVLRTNYVTDDAGTYAATGGSGALAGTGTFSFGPLPPANSGQWPPVGYAPYDADYPDTLAPLTGATASLAYGSPGSGTAAVQVSTGNYKIVHLGFPFECITSDAARASVMSGAMNFLLGSTSDVNDWALY